MTNLLNHRASGILVHPTSLPGLFGSGDFGADAYRFVDWLKKAGQTYWQVLPMGEIGPGNSPYMSSSAFAGNVLFVDIAELANQGWLHPEDLVPYPGFQLARVDYPLVSQFRMQRLRRAAKRFFASSSIEKREAFEAFCQEEHEWLNDYALFMAILEHEGGKAWNTWPKKLAFRESNALRNAEIQYSDEVNFWKFCQWNFSRQWSNLKEYANRKGIFIIGDVPIFVAFQSADVWAKQHLFDLDEMGNPRVVAGVPPDYFSETGQRWGNPLYRWNVHEQEGYQWWVRRVRKSLQDSDIIRIDHFRGFAEYWEIPAASPTAVEGKWMPGPKDKLFYALKAFFPDLPIIAEDLGVITSDVTELRDRFQLPGMRILQFAFGDTDENPFLPHNYIINTVAYTGTHDNNTCIGWWEQATEHEKSFLRRYLGDDIQAINWSMINAISTSKANTAIFPMQDIIGLAGDCRMNYPGRVEGSWEWRFSWNQVLDEQTQSILQITTDNNRII